MCSSDLGIDPALESGRPIRHALFRRPPNGGGLSAGFSFLFTPQTHRCFRGAGDAPPFLGFVGFLGFSPAGTFHAGGGFFGQLGFWFFPEYRDFVLDSGGAFRHQLDPLDFLGGPKTLGKLGGGLALAGAFLGVSNGRRLPGFKLFDGFGLDGPPALEIPLAPA